MAGCGGGSCGINLERERERQRALEAVRRAYPALAWDAFRPDQIEGAGLDLEQAGQLATHMEEVLPVRVFPRAAPPEDLGAFLYLLCGIHAPCLFELREGRCDPRAALVRARETYVRIGLSPIGPFATLQECEFELDDLGDGRRLVTERPGYGVENPDLKMIVTGLQGMLRRRRIVLLDFAFLLSTPAPGGDSAFATLYGGATPTLWSFLFDPAPPTTTRSTAV
jgi:hypothetical protein